MNLNALMEKIKTNPDYPKVGMILCHNGVVRETSRDGRQVSGIEIKINLAALEKIIAEQKSRPGIMDVLVELADEGRTLAVGEDVMYIVVAGDIRDRVISCLTDTLNAIKSSVTSKTEFFLKGEPHE
ncbi:MAG: molybdenum cofactor biosynthesis protein MoaE [Proteobacteria bacterium]|nr:molybdenum cofactor biosynthesis protein MoaE [Pseudomonadota bacterium]